MFDNLRKDFKRHGGSLRERTFWAMVTYRFGVWSKHRRWGVSRWITGKMYGMLRLASEILTGIVMDRDVTIGQDFHLIHPGQIQFYPRVVIGDRVGIMHGVTIGTNMGSDAPVIGNDVFIGANSSVLGKVKVGDHAFIAANTLVITDVPPNHTAIGVPAKMIPNFRDMLAQAKKSDSSKASPPASTSEQRAAH